MIIIRFADEQADRQALECLIGRFPFKSWDTGEMMLPEEALDVLTKQGIRFEVKGKPTYEQAIPAVRDSAPARVQRRKARPR